MCWEEGEGREWLARLRRMGVVGQRAEQTKGIKGRDSCGRAAWGCPGAPTVCLFWFVAARRGSSMALTLWAMGVCPSSAVPGSHQTSPVVGAP